MTTTWELEITKVTCRWDDQAGVTPGWYCEAWSEEGGELTEGGMVCDSQKVWFPVDVDQYGADEWEDLKNELQQSFGSAKITRS